MIEFEWREVLNKMKIPAKPTALWTKVFDYIEGPARLRIEAEGIWSYSKRHCGPEGIPSVGLMNDALVSTAPLGALVGKIGGSTAEKPDTTKIGVFAVGNYCVLNLDASAKGALFMTM